MTAVTMADLTHGTPVRHVKWNATGRISVLCGVTDIHWDDFGDIGVSPQGPVLPSDLEILGRNP